MPVIGRPAETPDAETRRLPLVTRVFHWTSMALVASMFTLIWGASLLGPGPTGTRLVNLHRSVGVTLFAVVVARLIWRLTHPHPPLPPSVAGGTRRLAAGVQVALYAGLLAMPLIGWIASDMAGDIVRVFGLVTLPSVFPMDEDSSDLMFAVHGWVALALLAFIALHVAGALRHRFILRDGVMNRML